MQSIKFISFYSISIFLLSQSLSLSLFLHSNYWIVSFVLWTLSLIAPSLPLPQSLSCPFLARHFLRLSLLSISRAAQFAASLARFLSPSARHDLLRRLNHRVIFSPQCCSVHLSSGTFVSCCFSQHTCLYSSLFLFLLITFLTRFRVLPNWSFKQLEVFFDCWFELYLSLLNR